MISDTDIQLYLRRVLVDGLEDIKKRYKLFAETPIKILFSNNSPEENYSNIYIKEYYGAASHYEYADFSQGSGFYALELSDKRDTDLRVAKLGELLLEYFATGTHDINDTLSIVINSFEIDEIESEKNDDKIHYLIRIYFTKFNNDKEA